MEKFKEKVQKRNLFMAMALIFLGAAFTYLSLKPLDIPPVPDFIRGFQTGAFTSIELILVFFMVKNLASMRDEKKLKQLYIEENDERTVMIMQKTGAMGMAICTMGLAGATVIAGFFNEVVFFSLLGATLFTALIKGLFKLYYHFKL